MQVAISSRRTVITPRLEEVTREKISRLSRYIDGMERAEVHFAEEHNPRITDRKDVCEVTIEGHGHHVRCKVAGPDPFTALDRAVSKLDHQLHKLKTKLVRRYHGGVKSTANGRDESTVADMDEDDTSTTIVKTKRFVMEPMSPVEAAWHMEILGHTFFFFANRETGRAAVVYRRDDGAVGLIDEAEE
ncbi:MAG TPA: ribosome-associated translation inhibitor RaiA [Acidimicrobiales bacterium]|jgi:putative sigma-54 modulation protein|nr:ribosome-associated translation inhibitor RaiA [Acidimicrobiales bacterium]